MAKPLIEASRWEVVVFKQDPVCGDWLTFTKSHATVYYRGETYHMCSPLCEALFKRDPDRQLHDPIGHRGRKVPRRELAQT